MMENPEESDQDDMIQVETLTTGGTARTTETTEAQKKLQEERTAVLKEKSKRQRAREDSIAAFCIKNQPSIATIFILSSTKKLCV